MSANSEASASDLSFHQSGHPFPVGGAIEPLVDADTAAEFLQVSPRRILELARRGALPGYPIGSGPRHLWRFRISELATSFAERGVNCANAAVCAKEKNSMARTRNQHGSLRILSRKSGDVFEYRYYRTRADGKRVPANFVVGSVAELKTETEAWAKLRKTGFDPNPLFQSDRDEFRRIVLGEIDRDVIGQCGPSADLSLTRHAARRNVPMRRKADCDGGHRFADRGEGCGHVRGFERLYAVPVPRMQVQFIRAGLDDIKRIACKLVRRAWYKRIEILATISI